MSPHAITFYGNDAKSILDGAKIILQQYGFSYSEDKKTNDVLVVHVCQNQEAALHVSKHGCECEIFYAQKAHFFRGLTLLLQNSGNEEFLSETTAHFSSNGAMMDCSRNGVPTINTIKRYIVWLAQFGMNRLYLYLEDILQLEDYPHWGYLRGRYSKEEIREVDDYAQQFGIALVPCVQTLAHLLNVLKQPAFSTYRDIDDILLLEEENTHKLLRALLETISDCFSTGIVHLGMDEAANLGRGQFMDKHGFVSPEQLMQKHLAWLLAVCREYNLQPIIWSDMYLRFNFRTEDYYGIAEDAIPQNDSTLSTEVGLCYWDYYNEGQPFYEKYIRLHKKLGNPVLFAGGAWTWNGIAPNISKAVHSTRDALNACIATDIKDVFFTMWMDNGAETPLDTCLPTLAWYGEFGFGSTPTLERVKQRFAFCLHRQYEAYLLLDAFDNCQYEKEHNRWCVNPSKTIFYEDPLMPLCESAVDEEVCRVRYVELCEKLQTSMQQMKAEPQEVKLFAYYSSLAKLLSQKANLHKEMQNAYHAHDKEKLRTAAGDLQGIAAQADILRQLREDIWMAEYKPFGFEVLDIRMAGVAQRARTASNRILAFLSDDAYSIPELDEIILPIRTPAQLEKELLHGYYFWDRIVSAGSVGGM